jgi:hypothetical protein
MPTDVMAIFLDDGVGNLDGGMSSSCFGHYYLIVLLNMFLRAFKTG